MSVEQLKLALDAPIIGPAMAVLHVLAWYADKDGRNCWPSVPTIARQSGVSERAVRDALVRLKTLGWVHLETASRGTLPNSYRLTLPLHQPQGGITRTPAPPAGLAPNGRHQAPSTPAPAAATPAPPAANPSGSVMYQSSGSDARAGDPHGPALQNGHGTVAPETIAAAKQATRVALGLPPVRTTTRKPFWSKPEPAPATDRTAALAEIAARRKDVPR